MLDLCCQLPNTSKRMYALRLMFSDRFFPSLANGSHVCHSLLATIIAAAVIVGTVLCKVG